jgi:glycosyltransferase involved in cell wall biosynthesis
MDRSLLPPITVLTPVYNGARYISETIQSVLRQDYPSLEYIVLDDGSKDESAAIVTSFRDRVRFVSQLNTGEARTINRGVALASHDIICIVNADDPVLPGLLHRAGRTFERDSELSGAYPDWIWIDSKGRPVRNVVAHEFDLRVMLEQHLCIPGPGALFRRSHLAGEPARIPERRSSADFDFWLRLALRGKVCRLPATLATWRQHTLGTSSSGCNLKMAEDKVEVIRAFFSRSDLSPEIRTLERQALSAAYHNAGMLGLRGTDIPAFRYFIKSLLTKPIWPSDVYRSQRRSLPHMAYAAAQPFSGRMHEALTSLLPEYWARRAVLEQRFGVRHEP